MLSGPLLAVLIQTLTGTAVDALRAPAGAKAIVYIFTSTDCHVSNRYAPEVQRIVRTFAPQGVVFRLIYPSRTESEAAIRAHQRAFAFEGLTEALRDPALALVKFSGATITPEAVVVVNGAVVYRGRIDDRYVELGRVRPAPTRRDLRDALDAVLAGRPVPAPETKVSGCTIKWK